MRNLILLFLLFVLIQFVDSQKEPTPLTSGVTWQGTLPALSTVDGQYDLDLFSIFITENATSLNISFVNGNSAQCGSLHLYLRTFGLPCNEEQYNNTFLCSNGYDLVDFDSDDDDDDDDDDNNNNNNSLTKVLRPGEAKDQWDFALNQNTYIGVGRSAPNTYTVACTYSLTVSVNSPCGIGQIGTDRSDIACVNYIVVDNTNLTYTQSYNPGDTQSFQVYKLNVPENTGNIAIVLNSTVSRNEIEGKSYSIPGDTNNCDVSHHSDRSGDFYLTTLVCYVPSAGDFYILVGTDRNDYFKAELKFTINACGSGVAGGQCQYPLVQFLLQNETNSNSTNTNNVRNFDINLPDPFGFYYWYIDIPENFTYGNLSLQINPLQSFGRVRVRNNAPFYNDGTDDDDNDDYTSIGFDTPLMLNLNQYEWEVSRRLYLAFGCATRSFINSCAFTVTATFPIIM